MKTMLGVGLLVVMCVGTLVMPASAQSLETRRQARIERHAQLRERHLERAERNRERRLARADRTRAQRLARAERQRERAATRRAYRGRHRV